MNSTDGVPSAGAVSPSPAQLDIHIPHLRPGGSISLLPIGAELAAHIGRVAVYWSLLEANLWELFGDIASQLGETETWAKTHGYGRRSVVARKLIDLWKSMDSQSVEAPDGLRAILDSAADLQWRRNIVLHGRYSASFPPHSSEALFRATGLHNGRPVTLDLDVDSVSRLWHDIAQLDAQYRLLIRRTGTATDGLAVIVENDPFIILNDAAKASGRF